MPTNGSVSGRIGSIAISRRPGGVVFNDLTLATDEAPEDTGVGVLLSSFLNVTEGAVVSIEDDAEGRFALNVAKQLVRGLVPFNFEQAPAVTGGKGYSITVRQTIGVKTHDTVLTFKVTDVAEPIGDSDSGGFDPPDPGNPSDPVPLEHIPGWQKKFGGHPGKGRAKNGKLATVAGVDTAYSPDEPIGSANRNAHAKLHDVASQQGYIAPLLIDEDNFAGTTYDPATTKIKAVKKVAGVETLLGEIVQAVTAGQEIGGIVWNGDYYITYQGSFIAGPFDVNSVTLEDSDDTGLVISGAATDPWIDDFDAEEQLAEPAPPTFLRTVVGNGDTFGPGGQGNSGNAFLVRIVTPAGAPSKISEIQIALLGYSSTVSLKPLIYADDGAGEPTGAPLAVGSVYNGVSNFSDNFLHITLPLGATHELAPSTAYWIGVVPSGGTIAMLTAQSAVYTNTTGRTMALNYASPGAWNSATDAVSGYDMIWAVVEQAATISGDYHQGNTNLFGSLVSMSAMFPPHAIGDTLFIDFGEWFGTVPTFTGWTTVTNESQSFGMRHIILKRVIDGTENGVFHFDSPTNNNRTFVISNFRNIGPEENITHGMGVGTVMTSPAVTTTSPDRRVYNFGQGGEAGGGTANAQRADTWSDVYSFGTLQGNDYHHSLSYKDMAAAGNAGAESRDVANSYWHVTSLALPLAA